MGNVTAIEAAELYLGLGLRPIPLPHKAKKPEIPGWPDLRLSKADLSKYFGTTASNVGLILGGDGTTDIDLDCAEALAAAGDLLPETTMVFGRPSKPASHYFYRSAPPLRSRRFLDPTDKACIAELRCLKANGECGLQTVVPPSQHPSGEPITFERGHDGRPSNVDAPVLQAAVAKVAAASLLARHWPGEKSGRNQAFLALAGALARGGWDLDQAAVLHGALYRILWGQRADLEAARSEVVATFQKLGAGFETTGRHSLEDLVDLRAVRAAFGWLGITVAAPRHEDAPPQKSRPAAKAGSVRAAGVSMEDLMNDDAITVPDFQIEGFVLKHGLGLLGGRPKDGKSWMACQTSLSIVTGTALGGWLKAKQPGRVQLWALEDQYPITKDKITKLLRGARPDGLRDLQVFQELAQPILRGGDQIIRAALEEHPAELVIFDSLFKLTGASQPTCDISQQDYDIIDRVRQIALEHDCFALIVMHTKKGSTGGNPIENILGTSGTSAAADVVAELKRTGHNGKLTVVGRLVALENYEMVWHNGPDAWGWTIESDGDNAAAGETANEILSYLEAQGAAKPATIATALHKTFGSVWMALQRLQVQGRVLRSIDKKWDLARRGK